MHNRQPEFGWVGGDRPGQLMFRHAASPDVTYNIASELQPNIGVNPATATLHSLEPTTTLVGRYCLRDGGEAWFLRISQRKGQPELEQQFVNELADVGLPVNRLLIAGHMLQDNGRQLRLDVRPLLQGEHFSGQDAEILELAHLLQDLHRVLRDSPLQAQIQQHAQQRYASLATMRQRIERALRDEDFAPFGVRGAWARQHAVWLRHMVAQAGSLLHTRPGAQCLHGEIHPGNVIFTDAGPHLVDFEDSLHTYAPPAWDYAYFVQRFILHPALSPSVQQHRLALVKDHLPPLAAVSEMVRQVSWLAVTQLLTLAADEAVIAPVAEYDKFLTYYDLADKIAHA